MMTTSSQLLNVCLLQMWNGQDNVSVIVADFGYCTIHPLFLPQISQVLNWHPSLIQQSYWHCGRFCRKVQANGAYITDPPTLVASSRCLYMLILKTYMHIRIN
jgi:hypothetical protein